eukprot:scpid108785/ scgid27230/ 
MAANKENRPGTTPINAVLVLENIESERLEQRTTFASHSSHLNLHTIIYLSFQCVLFSASPSLPLSSVLLHQGGLCLLFLFSLIQLASPSWVWVFRKNKTNITPTVKRLACEQL